MLSIWIVMPTLLTSLSTFVIGVGVGGIGMAVAVGTGVAVGAFAV